MTECNAIIGANKEINKLKRENKKLNVLCVEYGFEMGRLEEENKQLKSRIDDKNEYQRVLESKIRRLKDRVKTFEHNYGFKDIERYKKMDNPKAITHKRLWRNIE